MFDQWIDVLGLPMYVYLHDDAKVYCDKLYQKEDIVQRQRYVIAHQRCTCMSFIKGNVCKHLRMLHGHFEFLGGVGKYLVVDDVNEVVEKMKAIRPMLPDGLPSVVHCVTLAVELPENVLMIVSVRKINQEQYALAFGKSL